VLIEQQVHARRPHRGRLRPDPATSQVRDPRDFAAGGVVQPRAGRVAVSRGSAAPKNFVLPSDPPPTRTARLCVQFDMAFRSPSAKSDCINKAFQPSLA
jgi:hypothetical protein